MKLIDHPDYKSFIQFEGLCLDMFIEYEDSFLLLGDKIQDIREEIIKLECIFGVSFWTHTPWNNKLKVLNRSTQCLYVPINNLKELSSYQISKIFEAISNVNVCKRSDITLGILIADYLAQEKINLERMLQLVGLKVKAAGDTFLLLKENNIKELTVKEITL
jgi:hypothetical protein